MPRVRALSLVPTVMIGLALASGISRSGGAMADPSPSPARERSLQRLGADRWHAAGYRGQGTKIAVIDSGFRDWKKQLGVALPRCVQTASFRADRSLDARDSQHGILCCEVIHALAPDAQLLFANWEPDDPASFVRAIAWARQQGARVLSCSVIMPCWSDGEGGGPVHAELERVIGPGDRPGDMLAFACAGNIAQRHWSGAFQPDAEGLHLWRPGVSDNGLVPWNEAERVSVELCWPAGSLYQLQIVDLATGREVGQTSTPPGEYCVVKRFMPQAGARYATRVRHVSGPPAPFHLATLSAWLEHYSTRGSIPFPADGPEFMAVGAVEESGRRADYSSCGPNSSRPKPDFVAQVPFTSAARSRPFSGTSAAAPQAAGLAALILSRHPDWTARQIQDALRRWARDIDPPGHDYETGFGAIHLP